MGRRSHRKPCVLGIEGHPPIRLAVMLVEQMVEADRALAKRIDFHSVQAARNAMVQCSTDLEAVASRIRQQIESQRYHPYTD